MLVLKKKPLPQPRDERQHKPADPIAGLPALALLALFAGKP